MTRDHGTTAFRVHRMLKKTGASGVFLGNSEMYSGFLCVEHF
jgi:hypothetical protein